MMKKLIILAVLLYGLSGCNSENKNEEPEMNTFCNPVNISYRFCLDEPSRREAADPSIVLFKGIYYLFASKSGGYWNSEDLTNWKFIETDAIPVEDYAPTAFAIDDTLYFMASSHSRNTIYKSTDPAKGIWKIACEKIEIPVWDPAFFFDDDGQLYLYWGCSNINPIYGVKVDYKNNFSFIGEPEELIHANPENHGWEVPGDYNTLIHQSPWIEGAWMNKLNGKYYLQYAGPGTEFKSYSDGVYVSDNPLGPFKIQTHNPFVYKPEGFASGAGHGSTFTDKYGNYWYIGTITISQKHMFERRLGLYPVFLDKQGILYADTKFGDYPLIIPDKKINNFDEIFPGWMLLSYNKIMEVSSEIDSLPAINITDENIRTYWAAMSGNKDEYATIDLEKLYDIYALQINFAEHNTSVFGREKNISHKYIIKYSPDNNNWKVLTNKSDNENDLSHDYIQLSEKVNCRYLKIINMGIQKGNFALSGFRVFGKGNGEVLTAINKIIAKRNPKDRRSIIISWNKTDNATGYNISYGTDKNKLYQNYLIYSDTSVAINSLNAPQKYYFSVESFNENGVTKNNSVILVE